MASSKDILVLFKKSHECLADPWISKSGDPSHSIWSGVVEKYFFKSFNELYHRPLFFYVHGL